MDPILERIIDLGIGITKVHIKGKIEEQKLHDELENGSFSKMVLGNIGISTNKRVQSCDASKCCSGWQ